MRTSLNVLLLLAITATSLPAEARPRHPARGGPHVSVRVVVNPWAPGWAPVARPGWVWIAGAYAAGGVWIPGYWAPAAGRPDMVWVAGYWEGENYVEGFWREAGRPGMVWVDGYYDRGRYVPGVWQPAGPPAPPEPPAPPDAPTVHHDYE